MSRYYTIVSAWQCNHAPEGRAPIMRDHYLIRWSEPDSTGKQYMLTMNPSVGGSWISNERAAEVLKEHPPLSGEPDPMALHPNDTSDLQCALRDAFKDYIEAGGCDLADVYNLVDSAWDDAVDEVAEELKRQPARSERTSKRS